MDNKYDTLVLQETRLVVKWRFLQPTLYSETLFFYALPSSLRNNNIVKLIVHIYELHNKQTEIQNVYILLYKWLYNYGIDNHGQLLQHHCIIQ